MKNITIIKTKNELDELCERGAYYNNVYYIYEFHNCAPKYKKIDWISEYVKITYNNEEGNNYILLERIDYNIIVKLYNKIKQFIN